MVIYCHCGLEACEFETRDHYRRRYMGCPKKLNMDELQCGFRNYIDPEYPQQAKDVIDDLIAELREIRDTMIEERNFVHWTRESDMKEDAELREYVRQITLRLRIAYTVIIIILGIVFIQAVPWK